MGNLGFGSYRVSIKSSEHREALTLAIKNGIKLIDTSANYTDGDSERLIGDVLKELGLSNSKDRPILVTKAGYIQGKNLEVLKELNDAGKATVDLVDMTPDLKHSIHPDFLGNQLELSLSRLQVSTIDIFLLHNPEYFYSLHQEDGNIDEYKRRFSLAFDFLEKKVKEGKIKKYGVSSNTLAKDPNGKNPTSLAMLLEVAKKIEEKNGEPHHFKVIQFPLNLLEIDALERHQGNNLNLIEMAHLNGLMVLTNRPFNVIKSNGELFRIAEYGHFDLADFDEKKARAHFEHCQKIIEDKWNELRESPEDKLQDVEMIQQFNKLYDRLPSADAVDQVYFAHFFPFLASLWGGNGLDKNEAKPFYELLEISHKFARLNMTNKAREFNKEAVRLGLLPDTSDPLTVRAIQAYYSYGVDYVLVGMKKAKYVKELSKLIN